MRILNIFETHEQMMTFIKENVQHCCKYNERNKSISTQDTMILFRVVANQEDYLKIAGYELSCVFWHYVPEQDVKMFVQSRIRRIEVPCDRNI